MPTTMTTTLTKPHVQAAGNVAARLEAFLPLIHATGRRWARRIGRYGAAEDLAQEAALALWRVLRERPDAPAGYLKDAADHAVRDALARGKSVDRCLPRERQRTWRAVSLDALMEADPGWDAIEGSLIRRRHYGELPSPTEEVAVARIMLQDLRCCLTPRQRQVLEFRLQGYTREEIGARLGLGQTRVNTILLIIQKKAGPLWDEEPVAAPEPIFTTAHQLARGVEIQPRPGLPPLPGGQDSGRPAGWQAVAHPPHAVIGRLPKCLPKIQNDDMLRLGWSGSSHHG